jgi:8-oxo-dGTP pyrophosphatase MutT (NUDIX family)
VKEFDFKASEVNPTDEWSSLILVRTYKPGEVPLGPDEDVGAESKHLRHVVPTGFIFVIEYEKSDPKWKMPGGHKKSGETPLETAIRELHGETGLLVPTEQFQYIGKWSHTNRDTGELWWDFMFLASIAEDEQCWMNQLHSENEGEQPKFFTVGQFRELLQQREFLWKHHKMLDEKVLIL